MSTTCQQQKDFISSRVTITRFILQQFSRHPEASGEFTSVMSEFVTACKMIAMYVNKGPKLGVLGMESSENTSGDHQKTLDVLSNEVIQRSLEWGGLIRGMVSEELDHVKVFHSATGKYVLACDPLDGSSNIDVNVSVGTIFSILRAVDGEEVSEKTFLQQGKHQVAAGYVLYGPQTTLVLTTGNGVNGFTLDSDVGEFFLSHPNMHVPPTANEYAINCSRRRFWEEPVLRYVTECEAGKTGPRKADFNMRWVGSMVADVHRILQRGGVFIYPGDADSYSKGNRGKLRQLYEVNAMGFVMEQAGALASTGRMRCLDVTIKGIHERGAVMMGSKEEIERLIRYHEEFDAKNGGPPEAVKKLYAE